MLTFLWILINVLIAAISVFMGYTGYMLFPEVSRGKRLFAAFACWAAFWLGTRLRKRKI